MTLRRDLLVLMVAYPGFFTGIEQKGRQVWLVAKDGTRLLYDDLSAKTYDGKLADADLQDSLEQAYPLRTVRVLMPANADPGRFRSYPLLDALYGRSEAARLAQLEVADFGGQQLRFHAAAGAADRFRAAAAQTAALVKAQEAVASYAYPSSGTWNSRTISGTSRLSAHAYGIAIDLHAHPDDYWVKAGAEAGAARLADYPAELVRIFEGNGFIWGGKWNHFDIMHYEYRPEIVLKARWFSGSIDLSKPWHRGADTSSPAAAKAIAAIDRSLA